MGKSTAVLFDANLSGGVVIAVEDQTAEEFAEYMTERSGLWTHYDTEDGGAILTSEEWSIEFYENCEFDQAVYDAGETMIYPPDAKFEGYWNAEESEQKFRRAE